MLVTVIGLVAAFLTTIALMPQVYQSYKTKKTKNVSEPTFIILSLGVFLWLVYGIAIKDIPLILANSVTLLLTLSEIILKIKYG